jgi:hypothetical protein
VVVIERRRASECRLSCASAEAAGDAMCDDPTRSDPAEQLAALQDELYDLVVTRVTQTHAGGLRRLRRDAQQAAALAEDLAEAALRVADDDARPT